MLRLQEASQPAPQVGLFPAAENLTAILDRESRDKTGRVKVSLAPPADLEATAMLTAKGLCRDQVRRLVETAVSQRLAVAETLLTKERDRASRE
jgi:hypothetical protein